MKIGMIGLGRMGANMVRRIQRAGHEAVVFDVNSDAVKKMAKEGAIGAESLEDMVKALPSPHVLWMMLPVAFVDETIEKLTPLLDEGDIVIDGGNSKWLDDIRRSKQVAEKGIHYIDAGVSGGVWGLERGYCVMVGGNEDACNHIDPILKALAPG
ncbi:MAG: NAD(P)-binding domain-containing protein, partial [Gammaproteobacteria bacterium]